MEKWLLTSGRTHRAPMPGASERSGLAPVRRRRAWPRLWLLAGMLLLILQCGGGGEDCYYDPILLIDIDKEFDDTTDEQYQWPLWIRLRDPNKIGCLSVVGRYRLKCTGLENYECYDTLSIPQGDYYIETYLSEDEYYDSCEYGRCWKDYTPECMILSLKNSETKTIRMNIYDNDWRLTIIDTPMTELDWDHDGYVEKNYRVEYDYQTNYDLLLKIHADSFDDAFDERGNENNSANTHIIFEKENAPLKDSVILEGIKGLKRYHFSFCRDYKYIYDENGTAIDSQSTRIHVLAVKNFYGDNGSLNTEFRGITALKSTRRKQDYIYLFGDILEKNGTDQRGVTKTLIHEFGHLIADLTHVCIEDSGGDSYVDYANHDFSTCVMAQGRLKSECAQFPFDIIRLEFCGKCKEKIRQADPFFRKNKSNYVKGK